VTTAALPATARGWRVWLLVSVALAMSLAALLVPPIRQDLAYHDFADRRVVLGVPYGLNVLSNVGFLLAGGWSLVRVARAPLPAWERAAGYVFAVGLLLTGLGSAWYHAAPSNATLVWDRLPLSALFPTVFAVVIGDRVSVTAGRILLVPLALGAIGSVLWWHLRDDLRPYALAQFAPMVLIPLMLWLFDGRRPVAPLLAGVVVYAAGKLPEVMDAGVFALGGLLSGHTIKHLLAAGAAALIARWVATPAGAPTPGGRAGETGAKSLPRS
jgi:predicted membrane channel-forming protein YqfA (hemolysin III family)